MVNNCIVKYHYKLAQSQGCCGLYEVYRLKASYESEKAREKRIKGYLKDPISTIRTVEECNHLAQQLAEFSDSEMRWSYPIEWGFAGVLDRMNRGVQPNLIYMSDNMDAEGDVHTGPFSTKNFVSWIKEMDIGDIHETPPRPSHRGGNHPIQVWVWHPEWDKIEEVVNHCHDLARDYYKEIKNVEKQFVKARRDANRELIGRVLDVAGW